MKTIKVDKSFNNNKAKEIPEDINIGGLLKNSREEQNIDLDEVVRVTRIRRYNIEALENEEWDKLPSQVFVKGFLRSYADFLGLDKEMVLNYYLRTSPFQKYKPQVLSEIRPKSKRLSLIIIIPVLVVALIAAIIYLKINNISIVEKVFHYLETPSHVEKKGNTLEKEDVFLKEEKVVEKEKETALKPKSVKDEIVLEEPAIPKEAENEKPLSPRYILTANVNSQTWIAIYIDDEPVREYLFRPGQYVRWTANEGFDILVGNAGGIEFFLNGKEVGKLGPEGKVMRLKLPEG